MLFNKISIFDGGMGSMIEALGLDVTNVEDLNITNPLDIQKIHLSYALNGADYITTNTFGLNRIKYHGNYSLKELAEADCLYTLYLQGLQDGRRIHSLDRSLPADGKRIKTKQI